MCWGLSSSLSIYIGVPETVAQSETTQDSFWTGWDSFPCSSSHEPHAQGSSRVSSYTNYWHFYLCESVLALNVSALATTHPSSVWARVFVKLPPAPNWNRSKGVLQVLSGQCPHCRLQAPNSNWMAAFLWAFIWELHQFWSSQDWKPVFMAVINWFAWTEKETSMAGLVLLKSDRNNYGLSWLAAFKRWVLFSFQYQKKKKKPSLPPAQGTHSCSFPSLACDWLSSCNKIGPA